MIPVPENDALDYLRASACCVHSLFEIVSNLPQRYIAVDSKQYAALGTQGTYTKCGSFFYTKSRTSTVKLEGVCVSSWIRKLDLKFFTMKDVIKGLDIFSVGYGDRKSTCTLGSVAFVGPRHSSQHNSNPEHGNGKHLRESRYYRHGYSWPELQTSFEGKLRDAGRKTRRLFSELFGNYLTFIGESVADLVVWTTGSPDGKRFARETKVENKPAYKFRYSWLLDFIGYSNSPHFDRDLLSEHDSKRWMAGLDTKSKIYKYLQTIRALVGVGVPTTVGYNVLCGSDAVKSNLNAFFCQQEFAVPIKHCSAMLFFAWAIPHCTAIPVVHMNGGYHTSNKELEIPIVIAAWGNGDGNGSRSQEPPR
jgi:hypothetical protein